MLQFLSHGDLKYPAGADGALVKAFIRKTLAECETKLQPAAAATKEQPVLTEGAVFLHHGITCCLHLRSQKPC